MSTPNVHELAPSRTPLTRERVLEAAIDLIDREGLAGLTMRRLGSELGVEAMSLYKHVANKDAILDGVVEAVVAEIEIPAATSDWQDAMRRRARSARTVLHRHSWAIGLLESRRLGGSSVLRYQDSILGTLRSGGFSIEGAAHAFWLLDAYVYGHVVQETNLSRAASGGAPTGGASDSDESALQALAASAYPHLAEVAEHALTSPFSFDGEFEFGLQLILDGLERSRRRRSG